MGVTREQFERDLAEKNWVVEIRRDGRLLGFSTLLVCETHCDGRALPRSIPATPSSPEAWGSPALARTWIAAVNYLRAAFPSGHATGCCSRRASAPTDSCRCFGASFIRGTRLPHRRANRHFSIICAHTLRRVV
jgi:hypothetical protein